MKMQKWLMRVVFTLLCSSLLHVQSSHEVEDEINRSQFPNGFLFGASTSSYQVYTLSTNFLFFLLRYFHFVVSINEIIFSFFSL